MVDFRRIAILEPTLVFPRPLPAMSDREIISFARQWGEETLKNGADAWYFRFHRDYPVILTVQKAMQVFSNVKHIIPYPAREIASPRDCIHFRKGEMEISGTRPTEHYCLQGISCHNLAELKFAEAKGFDYAFFSPIFPTKTHPEAKALGLTTLKNACSEISIPIIALGGVNPENEAECIESGAWGIAGIRMFMT